MKSSTCSSLKAHSWKCGAGNGSQWRNSSARIGTGQFIPSFMQRCSVRRLVRRPEIPRRACRGAPGHGAALGNQASASPCASGRPLVRWPGSGRRAGGGDRCACKEGGLTVQFEQGPPQGVPPPRVTATPQYDQRPRFPDGLRFGFEAKGSVR